MSGNKSAVGLDLSLTGTGFALFNIDGTMVMETIKTKPTTCVNDLARLRYISDEIMKRIPKDVGMICVEDFFTPMGGHQMGAAINLAMLGSIVRMSLYEAGYPFFVVSPSQLKKYLTGKGVGQKSMILKEVFKRWGLEAKDDNQADAATLAHIAHSLLIFPMIAENEPSFQTDVIKTIHADRPRYNIKT